MMLNSQKVVCVFLPSLHLPIYIYTDISLRMSSGNASACNHACVALMALVCKYVLHSSYIINGHYRMGYV